MAAVKSRQKPSEKSNFQSSVMSWILAWWLTITDYFRKCKNMEYQNSGPSGTLKKPLFEKRRWSCDFPLRKRGCPKAPRDFPPRKDGIVHPRSGSLGTSHPLPQSLYGREDGLTYADVTTKIFGIDRLPNLLSNGAPLAGFDRRVRYKQLILNYNSNMLKS